MDLNELLEHQRQLGNRRGWPALLAEARAACESFAGARQAERIESVPLGDYVLDLRAALQATLPRARASGASALVLAYRVDQDWQGELHACPRFRPASDGDESWLDDPGEPQPAPDFPPFAEIFAELDDGELEHYAGSLLFLVARTAEALGKASADLELGEIALCLMEASDEAALRIHEPRRSTT